MKKEGFMSERTGIITLQGESVTLVGNEVKVGDTAPEFVALDNNLSPVKLSSFRGKICVLSSVPSLTLRFVTWRQGNSTRRLAGLERT